MASTLIATSTLEGLVQSGLPDADLEVLVDAADAEIIRLYGPHDGERTLQLEAPYSQSYIFLPAPAATVASITEQAPGETAEAVDADDYRTEYGGRVVCRIRGYWKQLVNVTYTPQADNARRAQALVDLVKLEAQFSGLGQQRIGEYSESPLDRERERNRILAGLRQNYAGAGMLA